MKNDGARNMGRWKIKQIKDETDQELNSVCVWIVESTTQ